MNIKQCKKINCKCETCEAPNKDLENFKETLSDLIPNMLKKYPDSKSVIFSNVLDSISSVVATTLIVDKGYSESDLAKGYEDFIENVARSISAGINKDFGRILLNESFPGDSSPFSNN